jgi:hypothetical protein
MPEGPVASKFGTIVKEKVINQSQIEPPPNSVDDVCRRLRIHFGVERKGCSRLPVCGEIARHVARRAEGCGAQFRDGPMPAPR